MTRKRVVQIQRLSICECGFPLLKVEIGIGAEYTIDLDSVSTNGWHLKCGGCGTVIRDITTVMASSTLDPNRPPARLPYAIFLGSRVAPVLTTPTRQDKTQ